MMTKLCIWSSYVQISNIDCASKSTPTYKLFMLIVYFWSRSGLMMTRLFATLKRTLGTGSCDMLNTAGRSCLTVTSGPSGLARACSEVYIRGV